MLLPGKIWRGDAIVADGQLRMKISVLTPSFNTASYIRRAIDSVLAQDYNEWEHIVMDGGSTDGTTDILASYPHLIWDSGRDLGQSDAMNKAFAKATGDLIIYLNADDELEPGLFSHVVRRFASEPAIDMVIGYLRMNKDGAVTVHKPAKSLSGILSYGNYSFPLNPACYVYRRSVQERIGIFPVENHYTMDYWFLLRAFLRSRVDRSEMIFGTFHFDGKNKSADAERSKRDLRAVRNEFVMANFYRPPVTAFLLRRLLAS